MTWIANWRAGSALGAMRQIACGLCASMRASVVMLLFGVTAHGQSLTPVNNVLPTIGFLGPGWQRQVEALVDPSSTPPEIFHAPEQISDGTLKEWRRAVADPTNKLSGWCNARFDFHSSRATNYYYLHVERYRSKDVLEKEFAQMLAGSPRRQRSTARGIGDAAFV